jgi:hypothetical protein
MTSMSRPCALQKHVPDFAQSEKIEKIITSFKKKAAKKGGDCECHLPPFVRDVRGSGRAVA